MLNGKSLSLTRGSEEDEGEVPGLQARAVHQVVLKERVMLERNEKSSGAQYSNIAGALIFIGALQWFIIEMAAETLFPGYSTRANDLSDLASTVPPNLSLVEPSATMFNSSTFIFGLATLVSAFLIYHTYRDRLFTSLFAISGLAAMAVGIFPGDTGVIHGLVALAWFVTAPLSAIAAYRLERKPFGYLSAAIGIFALVVLLMALFSAGSSPIFMAFGRGGEERMIAFPVAMWVTAFGGYLMGSSLANANR
jgi:hypothetical membrane protein